MQPWFPNFNPLAMTSLETPVWVRLPNFPIHLTHPYILEVMGNLIGHFIKIDIERLSKRILTFVRICVEVDLNKGSSNKILLKWRVNVLTQLLDYEKTTFHYRTCQQLNHLQNVCLFSQGAFSPQHSKKTSHGWQDPKRTKVLILDN